MNKLIIFLPLLLFFSCSIEEKTAFSFTPKPNPCILPGIDSSYNVEYIFEDYDCYFRFQGYLRYSGKYGYPNFEEQGAIDILPAWDITKGAGVKIMVFDDAIQKNHEEFENISVLNIMTQKPSCEPKNKNDYSHGTAVSGLICARENGFGIAGVAPECEFLFMGGGWEDADIIRAFEHAKNWGVKVISCSWGSYDVLPQFESAVKSFYEDGITIIFAAGNDYMNLDNKRPPYAQNPNGIDESELEWVIGVSAADKSGIKADFSNYGSNIDIMAPGVSILTLDLMGSDGRNNGSPYVNDNYFFINGTSFSAPIVAGVAVLMIAANPSLTPTQVRQIIIDTARKNGSGYNENGFSLHNAHGLINAGRAVRKAAGLD